MSHKRGAAVAQGLPPYGHRYPFNDEKIADFFQLWRQSITEVRIIHDTQIHGKSQLQGAAIYINPNLAPAEQVPEALYQYYQHGNVKAGNGKPFS